MALRKAGAPLPPRSRPIFGRHSAVSEGLPVLAHKDTLCIADEIILRNRIGVAGRDAPRLTLLAASSPRRGSQTRHRPGAHCRGTSAGRAQSGTARESKRPGRADQRLPSKTSSASSPWLALPNPAKENVATIAEALDEASRGRARAAASPKSCGGPLHPRRSYRARGRSIRPETPAVFLGDSPQSAWSGAPHTARHGQCRGTIGRSG